VASLAAGQAAGGDVRGQQSAAVVVERPGAAAESREGIDRICDLRVDDHVQPVGELERLLAIHLRWDAVRRASAHFAPGRYEHGITILKAAAGRFPDDAVILYDLACFQALGGDVPGALAHLRRAIDLDPGLRAAAALDRDFAALSGDAGFSELVGGPC
jgi:tetratricopeptide (TPR) repeat protein